MSAKGSTKEQGAVVQIAQLIMDQRGERKSQRVLAAYAAALLQRMREISADQQHALSGAELFRSIARKVPLTWEELPEGERALYTTAVQDFISEQEVLARAGSGPAESSAHTS
jgi:hypothetical protein